MSKAVRPWWSVRAGMKFSIRESPRIGFYKENSGVAAGLSVTIGKQRKVTVRAAYFLRAIAVD